MDITMLLVTKLLDESTAVFTKECIGSREHTEYTVASTMLGIERTHRIYYSAYNVWDRENTQSILQRLLCMFLVPKLFNSLLSSLCFQPGESY